MRIYAHRGLWTAHRKQNSMEAHLAALRNGFGAEIDIRDQQGEAVIAHDPGEPEAIPLREFFTQLPAGASLALNMKSCGLLAAVQALLPAHADAFYFDLPGPEMHFASSQGLRFFNRCSPFEPGNDFPDSIRGSVLDSFGDLGFSRNLEETLDRNPLRSWFVISDEIHGHDPTAQWTALRNWRQSRPSSLLMLCTDQPQQAKDFFSVPASRSL